MSERYGYGTYEDPDRQTDDQLLSYDKRVVRYVKRDGAYDATLSCGHKVTFVIEPVVGVEMPCAQCVEIALDRHRKVG